MTLRRHFIKTNCISKISQISELQNHLQKKSNLHNSICHSYLIQKSQFAMMVPVVLSLIIHIVFHKQFKVIIALCLEYLYTYLIKPNHLNFVFSNSAQPRICFKNVKRAFWCQNGIFQFM